MKQTFTASEVRRQASTFGRGRVNNMLRAYADRLEADEKAVPYCYTCEQKNGLSQGAMCRSMSECEASELYDPTPSGTMAPHPSPSDAEQPSIPDLTDDEWMILFHERPDLKIRLNAIFDRADYLSRYRSQCKTKIAPVDERAVPVAWMHFYRKIGGGTRMWFPTLVPKAEPQDGYEWVETRPLQENTHPSPADAERLAEALQEILDYRGGAANALEDEYVVDRAHQALAAHSAQARSVGSSQNE